MQDDATSRAREVIAAFFDDVLDVPDKESDTALADDVMADLAAAGLALYDTRTHVAIPREPSEADVSRIASVLFMCGPDMTFHDQARAAIAALVAEQTQGGEPDV